MSKSQPGSTTLFAIENSPPFFFPLFFIRLSFYLSLHLRTEKQNALSKYFCMYQRVKTYYNRTCKLLPEAQPKLGSRLHHKQFLWRCILHFSINLYILIIKVSTNLFAGILIILNVFQQKLSNNLKKSWI